jgi:hypothetical protein
MTRARALKQVIRARIAKTGERYTTARRQVLKDLDQPTAPIALVPKAASKSVTPVSTKGGLSDAKSIEKTGHGLAHWFEVLDKFGAVEEGHTKAADHLYSKHGVPGWYAQGITVAYERAHGVRGMNQRCDGAFEVSVSKMIAATPAKLIATIKNAKKWSGDVDTSLVKSLVAALADKKSKGFVIRPDGQARFRYKWASATVQFNMYPKGPSKTSFVVSHMNLASADAVETNRAKWKAAFAALAGTVAPAK